VLSNFAFGFNLGRYIMAAGVAVRLIHGTGDGFDGLTVDLIGPALLLEEHRRWAVSAPLLAAIKTRLGGVGLSMFVKKRWSRDPAQRGGVQVAGGRALHSSTSQRN